MLLIGDMTALYAIYRCVTEPKEDEETLVYNSGDGFAWIKSHTKPENTWHVYAHTAGEAEAAARKAGFDPKAIYYPCRL